ncbi:UNVERIFIED_CONTAM: hypothetical protein Sradi_1089800 [Sesamum radiatum]|uniref:DC1 domain-containing protein n=1 Tax=Sesamum radiatum TaxID=300843 RepID=A0AAW2VB97_SESRA
MALIMKISGVDGGEIVKQQFSHFSHRHPLELSQLHQEDKAVCSGCELDILGSAYVCTKPNCTFLLHDFCFDLPRQIRHLSHPKHPLGLSFPPTTGSSRAMHVAFRGMRLPTIVGRASLISTSSVLRCLRLRTDETTSILWSCCVVLRPALPQSLRVMFVVVV